MVKISSLMWTNVPVITFKDYDTKKTVKQKILVRTLVSLEGLSDPTNDRTPLIYQSSDFPIDFNMKSFTDGISKFLIENVLKIRIPAAFDRDSLESVLEYINASFEFYEIAKSMM
ncbi:hypothetical protein AYI69_g5073 [Smittium culicis]|uniref:Uncharacterized protein n=1 Tax=Smittium culicis TaxID=133412 RepID=A0A1R1Y8P7_9FUNG|nr:hypothetical protein AYI69_g5073 [Smittium culicis]